MELKIEYLPIEKLKPYSKNTRHHEDHDVDQIIKSINKYGFSDPIGIWSEKNIIVEGHGRFMAAKKIGMETVPVLRLDHLTDEQRREYAIMHNRTAELSSWDFEALAEEMAELDLGEFDMDGLTTDPEVYETQELQEVEAPEPPTIPKAKRGEIYQLGDHRLMCGDSTNPEDVTALMNGEQADMCVTDPPYNVDYEGKTKDKLKIENDQMESEAFQEFLKNAFQNINESLKPGGAFYIWYASREVVNFQTALERAGLTVRQQLIWVKNIFAMGRQDYQWRHEPCLYGWKDGAAHYFVEDRTQSTVTDSTPDFESIKKEEAIRLLKDIYKTTTIIYENKPSRSELHPTMKPINLIGVQVRNSSKLHDSVLDLFGGSGTTLLVCEQTKRRCYMMEYDPCYIDVIIKRWEEYTGKKAELIKPAKE